MAGSFDVYVFLRACRYGWLNGPSFNEKPVVTNIGSWHFYGVKTISSKSTATDIEVRQLHATGKRIASNRKSILRVLAATGMYTAGGKLKPQFR